MRLMALVVVLIMAAALPAAAGEPVPRVGGTWPVGVRPSVVRGWEPPATAYGRGHRGVDLAAPPGTPVHAAAGGTVSFAGRVAGRGVISVDLTGTGDPPLRTTYEPVRADVRKGDSIPVGAPLGTLELPTPHCRQSCLHWGLRRGKTYLNPLGLLPPWLLQRPPSRLLPVTGVPLLRLPSLLRSGIPPGPPASWAGVPHDGIPLRLSPLWAGVPYDGIPPKPPSLRAEAPHHGTPPKPPSLRAEAPHHGTPPKPPSLRAEAPHHGTPPKPPSLRAEAPHHGIPPKPPVSWA
ncbi:hypothetical protein E2651_34380, partial [Streptomyces sp. MZ04]